MVDMAVKSEAAWACRTHGGHLADVVLPVHLSNKTDKDEEELGQSDTEGSDRGAPVLLEQMEDGAPCVLTLHCSPGSPAAICRLLVISEARTMEVYDQAGEYCGTVRGARDHRTQSHSSDRGPLYRKQLILEQPSASCEVKLLSLAGRSSVLVCRVVVGLQSLLPCPARGPGIDMQQVQSLVEEMGTSLSPGAQNLMEMVQFQQKNQTGSLGGFLPLLMGGGAFSALAGGVRGSPAALSTQAHPADSVPPESFRSSAPQNGGSSSSSSSSSDLPLSDISTNNTGSSEDGGPLSQGPLLEMISRVLKGRSQALDSSPELLPMLQSVCGQVTQLRLDEKERTLRNGSWELDSAMDRRLEEMERRLKDHVDRRLDALEQKLEKALQSALQSALNLQEGGVASTGASEDVTAAPTTP